MSESTEYEILSIKKQLRRKYPAASSDALLLKAIKQYCKDNKIKLRDLPNMKHLISGNIQNDPSTKKLKILFENKKNKMSKEELEKLIKEILSQNL